MDNPDYDLALNNCSHGSGRALEQLAGKKINSVLFNTPGDTRDFMKANTDAIDLTGKMYYTDDGTKVNHQTLRTNISPADYIRMYIHTPKTDKTVFK